MPLDLPQNLTEDNGSVTANFLRERRTREHSSLLIPICLKSCIDQSVLMAVNFYLLHPSQSNVQTLGGLEMVHRLLHQLQCLHQLLISTQTPAVDQY